MPDNELASTGRGGGLGILLAPHLTRGASRSIKGSALLRYLLSSSLPLLSLPLLL